MTGTTIRFINFIFDTSLFLVIMMAFFYISKDVIDRENVKWISVVAYFFYYFLFEFFSGKTPGKMVTKSKVVSISKTKQNFFTQILFRTLMRFIPFDLLSYFFSFRGLHDRISNTSLIKL